MTRAIHKTTLRRVRLNQGGYDAQGAYWGTGIPLWYFAFHDQFSNLEHSDHIRAHTRDAAKHVIRQRFTSRDMRFYN